MASVSYICQRQKFIFNQYPKTSGIVSDKQFTQKIKPQLNKEYVDKKANIKLTSCFSRK